MEADPEIDLLFWGQASISLDPSDLDLNGAAHRAYDAPELDDAAITGTLDDPTVMHRDGRVDQIAAKGAKAREDSIFIRTRKPRTADDVGHQNRSKLSGLAHSATSVVSSL